MISAIELLNCHPEIYQGKKLKESDFFIEFDYNFGLKKITFSGIFIKNALII